MNSDVSLRLEPYDAAKHYSLLADWWKAYGDEALPADVLPPTGAVALRDDVPVALCSIWLTNAKCAYLAFPIAAPGISSRVTYEAMMLAIKGAVDLAKHAGCKMIWATAENRGVDRIFRKHVGFVRTTPLHSYFLMLDPTVRHDTLTGDLPNRKADRDVHSPD
jgi:hypothetical protein